VITWLDRVAAGNEPGVIASADPLACWSTLGVDERRNPRTLSAVAMSSLQVRSLAEIA
jgi:hypothetical protein